MASQVWRDPIEATTPDVLPHASFLGLPPETIAAILLYLGTNTLRAVSLTCTSLRDPAARLLHRKLVLRWNRNLGFHLARLEAILTSSEYALSNIRRIDIIQVADNAHSNSNTARQPPPGLKPAEDLLLRLLIRKLRPDQLRFVSLSSVEGICADTAALLLSTQRNLTHLDLSTRNEIIDIMPFAFSINNLQSFGFHLGESEVAVSKAFAFMYHVLKRNCDTLKSLYLSFSEKSELYKELERDSVTNMNTQNQEDSATAQILRLFVGGPSSEGEMIHFRSLRQLRLQRLPSFGALFNMGGPTLTERLNLENIVLIRIDHCNAADELIRNISGSVPNIRILQLVRSCDWATIETVLVDLPPLEVLHVKFTDGKELGSAINPRIFDRHRERIRSMWLECLSSGTEVRAHTISCLLKLFKAGSQYLPWPKLQQLAIQADDYGFMCPYFSTLRYLRILPGRSRQVRTITSEKEAALRNCDMYLQSCGRVHRQPPTLQVISATVSDAPAFANANHQPCYFVVEFVKTMLGGQAPVVSRAKPHDIRQLFPTLNLIEFERGERVWGDVDGEILA
ncbi:hypothetical protein TWF730_003761 [Orbilia blumenaviensis]|uniref:F-box domain-containing protein n=1 Tax=Orbilia blumenaviensis TaxID=1796055 RepID=A0AAV9U7H4_9PEZI